MRWKGNRESDNVEDRRGEGAGSFRLGGGPIGIGTAAIALLAAYFLGINPLTVLDLLSGDGQISASQETSRQRPSNNEEAKFVSTILADTEDTWTALLRAGGAEYVPPKLVLFSGRTPTACGTGMTATGPFYCPLDRKIYIDLSFYRLLQRRFDVTGEFAQAYVIAHEVGHHVQNLLGISAKADDARKHMSPTQANALSVRLELQADCFAGVWAYHANQARSILESGDIEAALHAASAIGDDALQKEAQGYAVPDSFTHGTSTQRMRWFRRGIDRGQIKACNTFDARQL